MIGGGSTKPRRGRDVTERSGKGLCIKAYCVWKQSYYKPHSQTKIKEKIVPLLEVD